MGGQDDPAQHLQDLSSSDTLLLQTFGASGAVTTKYRRNGPREAETLRAAFCCRT